MCFDARTERRRFGLAATCASVGDVGRDDLVSVPATLSSVRAQVHLAVDPDNRETCYILEGLVSARCSTMYRRRLHQPEIDQIIDGFKGVGQRGCKATCELSVTCLHA